MTGAEAARRWRERHPGRAAEVQKRFRANNKTRVNAAAKGRRDARRALIADLKSQPCADCGGRFHPCAMDFDHVRGAKVANVSLLIERTMEAIMHEIEKCDLVCANCHRVRTHHRGKSPAKLA